MSDAPATRRAGFDGPLIESESKARRRTRSLAGLRIDGGGPTPSASSNSCLGHLREEQRPAASGCGSRQRAVRRPARSDRGEEQQGGRHGRPRAPTGSVSRTARPTGGSCSSRCQPMTSDLGRVETDGQPRRRACEGHAGFGPQTAVGQSSRSSDRRRSSSRARRARVPEALIPVARPSSVELNRRRSAAPAGRGPQDQLPKRVAEVEDVGSGLATRMRARPRIGIELGHLELDHVVMLALMAGKSRAPRWPRWP